MPSRIGTPESFWLAALAIAGALAGAVVSGLAYVLVLAWWLG